jgi:hypothetical protein
VTDAVAGRDAFGQEQIRDVRRRDQQDHDDRAERDEDGLPKTAPDEIPIERLDGHAPLLLEGRLERREARADGLHLFPCLIQRDSAPEATHGAEPVVAAGALLRREDNWFPEALESTVEAAGR